MDTFIKLLVIVFLLDVFVSADGDYDTIKADLQRIESRLRLFENTQDEERLARKVDVDGLMDKLSRIEKLLDKPSGRKPANQNLIGKQERDNIDIDKNEREITRLMSSVKHAFSTEKKINMRLRREIMDKLKDHELLKTMIEGMLKMIRKKFSSLDKTVRSIIKPLVKKSDLVELNENCLKELDPLNGNQENAKNLVTMSDLSSLTEFIQEMKSEFEPHIIKSRSCKELYDRGYKTSGVYVIVITRPVQVYCDQETDGGGWIVFQRREDGSEDFNRNWDDYKKGFGDIEGEFWLGNDNIADLTMDCCHELRIDIGDFEGNVAYAKYSTFTVGPESSMYKLEVDGYSGNAGDSLEYHNGEKFTTKDSDNDSGRFTNCAEKYTGAWWFKSCHRSNLNGQYMTGEVVSSKGVSWLDWKNNFYPHKFSEMKLR